MLVEKKISAKINYDVLRVLDTPSVSDTILEEAVLVETGPTLVPMLGSPRALHGYPSALITLHTTYILRTVPTALYCSTSSCPD